MARTRKSIACVAAEKTASGADKATIELAAEKTTKRHRMSLCKAAETLYLAGLGDDAPEEVQKKIKTISKCLMVARGRHRMNVAAAVKETICGKSDEEETKTAKSEGNVEAKSSKDGPSDAKEASAPKATPKPKFMSKLRACAKEFQPSEKQLSIKQKIAAAVAAAYKRNGPVEKPEKSEVKEEWTTAYEDMSLYGYEDYSWQGQYGCDGSYGWSQMNCNQMGCNQMGCNQMGYQQTGYNQMACGGCGMGCQGRNQWQGNQWQGQVNNAAVSNAAAPTEPSVAPPPVLEQGNLPPTTAESAVLPPIAPPSESPKDDETKKAQITLPPINGALPAQSPKQEAPAGKSEEPLPPIDGEAQEAPSDSILDTVADALVEHAEQAGPEASQAKAQKEWGHRGADDVELQPEQNEKADKTQPNTTTSQEPTETPENGQAAEAAEEAHEPQEETRSSISDQLEVSRVSNEKLQADT
ncbi:unnamed protein product [Cladocopium goreaui]|uniref:Phosphopyruvate hydratase n=1 Tax=Cladocopium goreaui TaxID=2562237 RepID=A0A9P1G775_9DINO|nr:unnamed protein product [Cladocopium goreaui]